MTGKERDIVLTARQALIAAAVTGWCGDGFCSWSSPVERETLLAWGGSYQHGLSASALEQALDELACEGLFYKILYPIFEQPCYYCSYDSMFLEELPDPIADYINTTKQGFELSGLSDLIGQWNYMKGKFIGEWGLAARFWGLCLGQGSQGPSDGGFAPCLGPSCCCFESGEEQCNWELQFDRSHKTTFPDMSVLDCLHKKEWLSQDSPLDFCKKALKQMGYEDLVNTL